LPLGVLEEDYSAVKNEVDNLISKGVGNLDEHLRNHPDTLRNLVGSARIVSLNPALLEMYNADSRQAFVDNDADIDSWWGDEWIEYYANEIANLAKAGPYYEVERADTKIDGSEFLSRIHSFVVAGYEDSWKRVVTIHEDITQRRQVEAQLRESQVELERQVKERTHALRESETLLAQNANMASIGYAVWDYKKAGYITVSEKFAEIYGYAQAEFLATVTDADKDLELIHVEDRERYTAYYDDKARDELTPIIEFRIIRRDGQIRYILESSRNLFNESGELYQSFYSIQDITERKLHDIWEGHRENVLRMMPDRNPFRDILNEFLRDIETLNPGMVCSILLLDHHGQHFLHGAAPSLPDYFILGIEGLAIGPELGSFGAASHTGKRVIVEDIRSHPNRAAYLDLANRAGLRSCWSQPIISGESKVTGAFSIYHHQPSAPAPDDLKLMEDAASLISQVIDRSADFKKLQLAASVFTHTHEGITITDATGNIIDVNDAFTDITGYSREEAIGQNPRMLNSGLHRPEFYAAMWNSINATGHWAGEIWNRKKNGEVYAELLTISAVFDDSGIVQHYVALFSDITATKNHQQQLERLANYDLLTDLPNRLLFSDRLNQSIIQSQRRGLSIAVAYLDLDGFKAINDFNGHEVGDKILVAVAQLIQNVLREGDTLARMGGDEFVMVLVDLKKPQDCGPLLERILSALTDDPIEVDEVAHRISASIGVALYPQDEVDADILLRHADQAMYQAKQAGKNRYHIFDIEQDAAIQTQRENLENIRVALDQREFVLYYQPKVNMRSGDVIGAEALIRWQHPQRGLLFPITFLPIIENHRLGLDVGEWVLDTALQQMTEWHNLGLDIPVSVNISASQLQSSRFMSRLADLLAAYPDLQPHSLELEVLETSALEDLEQVSEIMYACMEIGVDFALDDFGTGYSSLTYLKRLPVEVLKIDQSFIRDMLDDRNDLAIVEGVIGLARAFRRQAIAEGVETVAHGVQLLAMGCEQAQGYVIARPMPAAELHEWASDWRPNGEWASA
jgi:diguanylate cyclase (GGDEF)-like protein/PAS domain S-box-containing protein